LCFISIFMPVMYHVLMYALLKMWAAFTNVAYCMYGSPSTKSVHTEVYRGDWNEQLNKYHFLWTALVHYPLYTRSLIIYRSNVFRCLPTPYSGISVQMQIPWDALNDHKHSLAARCKITLFHTEFTTFICH